MKDTTLADRQVLVVEDDFFLADDLTQQLEARGAVVIGPAPSVSTALDLIDRTEKIDCAILDVNLNGEHAYAVADALTDRGIPLVLTTGYEAAAIPQSYRHLPRCEKPVHVDAVARALFG